MSSRPSPRLVAAIDVETSGLRIPSQTKPGERPSQCIALGIIIIDTRWPGIPELGRGYWEIRFDPENYHWDPETEPFHGFTREYLADKPTMAQVGNEVYAFLRQYLDVNARNLPLGHNPAVFDVGFFEQVISASGHNKVLGYRSVDSFTASYNLYGIQNSDDLFTCLGLERGEYHNALRDIEASVELFRHVRRLGNRNLIEHGLPPVETPAYAREVVSAYLEARESPTFRGLGLMFEKGRKRPVWYHCEGAGDPIFSPVDTALKGGLTQMMVDGLAIESSPGMPAGNGTSLTMLSFPFLEPGATPIKMPA